MFIVGGLPALLLAWIRHGVTETGHLDKERKSCTVVGLWRPFAILFSDQLRRRTIVNALLMLVSICGLWAGTVYVPAAITAVAEAGGPRRPASCATRFVGRHDGFVRHHSRLPGDAMAR